MSCHASCFLLCCRAGPCSFDCMHQLLCLLLAFPPACYSESLGHTQHGGGTPGAGGGGPAPSRLFATDNFVDRTSAEGRFDFSEWVRAYGKYLEEQVGGVAEGGRERCRCCQEGAGWERLRLL